MKKFQFRVFAIMIMALVCVGFASCGSDDDDSKNKSNNTSDLVGIWAQYHQGSATAWYYGIKLDANGEAAYTEWDIKESPNWNYTGGAKWSVKDNVLTITAPNGSVAYSSFFTLSSDRKTITFAGDTTGGRFGTLKGEFTKQ
jgi:hypothetical protein